MNQEYVALFEPDENGWTGSVPDLPGCFSDGNSLEEVQKSIRTAIKLWIETAKSNDWPIPSPRTMTERIAV